MSAVIINWYILECLSVSAAHNSITKKYTTLCILCKKRLAFFQASIQQWLLIYLGLVQYGSLKSKIVSLRQIKISQWIIIIQSFCNKQEKINFILPSYLCQSCCFLSIFPSLAVFFFSLFMQQLLVLDYYNWGKNMIKTLEKMSWEKGHIKTAKANIMSVSQLLITMRNYWI